MKPAFHAEFDAFSNRVSWKSFYTHTHIHIYLYLYIYTYIYINIYMLMCIHLQSYTFMSVFCSNWTSCILWMFSHSNVDNIMQSSFNTSRTSKSTYPAIRRAHNQMNPLKAKVCLDDGVSNVRAAAVTTLANLVPHKGDEEVQGESRGDCTAGWLELTFSDFHTWYHMNLKLIWV